MLKGQWTVARHDFTDVALNGANIPIDEITVPSHGFCRVIPRALSDRYYDDEVLKSSLVHYYRRSGGGESEGKSEEEEESEEKESEAKSEEKPEDDKNFIGTQGERYAFRRRDGIWSLWDIGRPQQNPEYFKVADFRLREFKEELIGQFKTFEVVLDASPWNDEFGRNFFQMAFLKGRTLVWELRCRFDDRSTGTVRQWMDICTPIQMSREDLEQKEGSRNELQVGKENRNESRGGLRVLNQSLGGRREDENARLRGNENIP